MRAFTGDLRARIVDTASANASWSGRTSSTTVFTVPPRDIRGKVEHQLVRRREIVDRFGTGLMPMIALPPLVVITQYALARDDDI